MQLRARTRLLCAAMIAMGVITVPAPNEAESLTPEVDAVGAADLEVWPRELIDDYLRMFPELTEAAVLARLATLDQRKAYIDTFVEEPTFAGTWFDFASGGWNVRATNSARAQEMASAAARNGLDVKAHKADYTYKDLEVAAEAWQRRVSRLPLQGRFQIGVDSEVNRVVVTLPKRASDLIQQLPFSPMISFRLVDDVVPGENAACASRYACGVPLRGGVNIGPFANGNTSSYCSIGFTARAGDGSRWAYTAGHCIPQSEVDARRSYGHGEQYIGGARQRFDQSTADVARVQISNPYWLGGAGGYLYRTSTTIAEVHGAVTSSASIERYDPVCFSARSLSASDDNCGVQNGFDSELMFKVQELGVLCGGDSGGSAYRLTSTGQRIAYGLLSKTSPRNSSDCTTPPAWASFSSLPAINQIMDANSASQIRVETRP